MHCRDRDPLRLDRQACRTRTRGGMPSALRGLNDDRIVTRSTTADAAVTADATRDTKKHRQFGCMESRALFSAAFLLCPRGHLLCPSLQEFMSKTPPTWLVTTGSKRADSTACTDNRRDHPASCLGLAGRGRPSLPSTRDATRLSDPGALLCARGRNRKRRRRRPRTETQSRRSSD